MRMPRASVGAEMIHVHELRVLNQHDQVLVGPLSFSVSSGECLALLGDSGSGKTLTLRALVNLLPEGLRWSAEVFTINGRDARTLTDREWLAVRGGILALAQQDAGDALDPLKRIQGEVLEAARVHRTLEPRPLQAAQASDLLRRAGLSTPETLLRRWPHELSGGMRQRAVLASALSAQPMLLLADEPTTALDATVQRNVLTTLRELTSQGLAIILVSHDPLVVSQIADTTLRLSNLSVHPDASDPDMSTTKVETAPRTSQSEPQHAVLRVSALSAGYRSTRARAQVRVRDGKRIGFALEDVSFAIDAGRILGVVGESGAGKTTLARALTATIPIATGEVIVDGIPWSQLTERTRRPERWRVQWVPQDPLASFARGMSVESILREAVRAANVSPAHLEARVHELLSQVGLDAHFRKRQPRTLSGGQRQRVVIARALATNPHLLICDEAVSALDASARDGILNLVVRLARAQELAVLFISHDISVIARVSDDILVMKDGMVVEQGSTAAVLEQPAHPFTQALIADSGYSR